MGGRVERSSSGARQAGKQNYIHLVLALNAPGTGYRKIGDEYGL